MNMMICEDCFHAIDVDVHTHTLVEVGNMRRMHKEICLCTYCQNKRVDRQDFEDAKASRCEGRS